MWYYGRSKDGPTWQPSPLKMMMGWEDVCLPFSHCLVLDSGTICTYILQLSTWKKWRICPPTGILLYIISNTHVQYQAFMTNRNKLHPSKKKKKRTQTIWLFQTMLKIRTTTCQYWDTFISPIDVSLIWGNVQSNVYLKLPIDIRGCCIAM